MRYALALTTLSLICISVQGCALLKERDYVYHGPIIMDPRAPR